VIHLLAAYVLNYGPGPLQTDEVYPSSNPSAPVVALVHGGGFRSTAHDAAQLQPEAKNLQQAGFTAVIVNYDQGTITSETSDVVTGAQLVKATTLIGGSSGGTLAAYAAEQMPVTLISLSGDLDPAASLAYWSAQSGGLAATHVHNLKAAGVTSSTVPPVVHGTAYVYASVNEEPIVVTEAQGFGGVVTLVPGAGHAWAYWKGIKAQVVGQCT
jgi:pimeloyl-ACP methyl ester carboxylesterase